MEHLQTTFDQMRNQFSSEQFLKQALLNGADKSILLTGEHRIFLSGICTKLSRRTWKKKEVPAKQEELPLKISASPTMIENAIAMLKEAGYKVLKPTQNWEEI